MALSRCFDREQIENAILKLSSLLILQPLQISFERFIRFSANVSVASNERVNTARVKLFKLTWIGCNRGLQHNGPWLPDLGYSVMFEQGR